MSDHKGRDQQDESGKKINQLTLRKEQEVKEDRSQQNLVKNLVVMIHRQSVNKCHEKAERFLENESRRLKQVKYALIETKNNCVVWSHRLLITHILRVCCSCGLYF